MTPRSCWAATGGRVPAGRGARHRAVYRARRRGRRAAHRIRETGCRLGISIPRCRVTIWTASPPTDCIRASHCRCRRIDTRIRTTCRGCDEGQRARADGRAGQDLRSTPTSARSSALLRRSVATAVVIPRAALGVGHCGGVAHQRWCGRPIPVARRRNLNRTLKDWANAGVQVVGLDAGRRHHDRRSRRAAGRRSWWSAPRARDCRDLCARTATPWCRSRWPVQRSR